MPNQLLLVVATGCVGIIGGLLTVWIRSLLERVNKMEKDIQEDLDKKVELEIEVVLEKTRSIEKRVDGMDAKLDKIYTMLLELGQR